MKNPDRNAAQTRYDAEHPAASRNRMGQYATPDALAHDIVECAVGHVSESTSLRFLEPSVGLGAIYDALVQSGRTIERAVGIELDPVVLSTARDIWSESPLELVQGDFTALEPTETFNLIVANPPYVRHHHIPQTVKLDLAQRVHQETGLKVSGLTGLYCYFMLLSRPWLEPGGVAVWLVPSEFLDVNYGAVVRTFLAQGVNLIRVHRYDPTDMLFGDALTTSAVVIFKNELPRSGQQTLFTMGGSLSHPKHQRLVGLQELRKGHKWSTSAPSDEDRGVLLGDLFDVRIGIPTGSNEFFVISDAKAKALNLIGEHLVPLLPPPRELHEDVVRSHPDGMPDVEGWSWLLKCDVSEEEAQMHPEVWAYLQSGIPAVSTCGSALTRSPWYKLRDRVAAPILCNYMGSGQRPFRFILNYSKATATNVYLMLYPKPKTAWMMKDDPTFIERVWVHLNQLPLESFTSKGRVYSKGMYKLEPSELASVRISSTLVQDR